MGLLGALATRGVARWLEDCLQFGAAGFITKIWIRTTTPDFFFFFHCNERIQVSAYATALSLSACRGFGWEEASLGYAYIWVAQIKVYKQRRTPKVALKPQSCWRGVDPPAGVDEPRRRFHQPSRDVTEGRRKKNHSPQMFPLSPST